MQTLFRTPISIDRFPLLDQGTAVLTAGSCFADNLGEKLKAYKWPCTVNPFGTQFHPVAILELLTRAFRHDPLPQDLFLENDGATYHYYLPRTHFAASSAALQKSFTDLTDRVCSCLSQKESLLMLTFGSAWIYEKDQHWVSNCHQQPHALFQKRLLRLDETMKSAEDLLSVLPKSTKILLTLSPVRHVRDGLLENSLSKSLLRVFIQQLMERWPDRFHYFPAYEVMLDDLRDYRFYGDDMLHPNATALAYIWDLFVKTALTSAAESFVHRWTDLLQALEHRSLRPNSSTHRDFQRKLLQDLQSIPGIDLQEEIAKLMKDMENIGN